MVFNRISLYFLFLNKSIYLWEIFIARNCCVCKSTRGETVGVKGENSAIAENLSRFSGTSLTWSIYISRRASSCCFPDLIRKSGCRQARKGKFAFVQGPHSCSNITEKWEHVAASGRLWTRPTRIMAKINPLSRIKFHCFIKENYAEGGGSFWIIHAPHAIAYLTFCRLFGGFSDSVNTGLGFARVWTLDFQIFPVSCDVFTASTLAEFLTFAALYLHI